MDVSASRATDRDAGDDIAPTHGTGSPTHGGDTHPPARATEHDDACASDDFHISGQDSTTVDGGDSHSQYAARAPDDVCPSSPTRPPTEASPPPIWSLYAFAVFVGVITAAEAIFRPRT